MESKQDLKPRSERTENPRPAHGKMLLSQAIRKGSRLAPQGFGRRDQRDNPHTLCVSEAADAYVIAVYGRLSGGSFGALKLDNHTWYQWRPCPACAMRFELNGMLMHLNDTHKWTRNCIADWVETVEREIDAPSLLRRFFHRALRLIRSVEGK